MVGEQGPSIARGVRFGQEAAQAMEEIVSIPILLEDPLPFNPPDDQMMQGRRCIKAGFAGHGGNIEEVLWIVKKKLIILWTSPFRPGIKGPGGSRTTNIYLIQGKEGDIPFSSRYYIQSFAQQEDRYLSRRPLAGPGGGERCAGHLGIFLAPVS